MAVFEVFASLMIAMILIVIIFAIADRRHQRRAWREANKVAHRAIYGRDPD